MADLKKYKVTHSLITTPTRNFKTGEYVSERELLDAGVDIQHCLNNVVPSLSILEGFQGDVLPIKASVAAGELDEVKAPGGNVGTDTVARGSMADSPKGTEAEQTAKAAVLTNAQKKALAAAAAGAGGGDERTPEQIAADALAEANGGKQETDPAKLAEQQQVANNQSV